MDGVVLRKLKATRLPLLRMTKLLERLIRPVSREPHGVGVRGTQVRRVVMVLTCVRVIDQCRQTGCDPAVVTQVQGGPEHEDLRARDFPCDAATTMAVNLDGLLAELARLR